MSEEAQRVFDAIEALGQIADPSDRAKEVGAVLKNLPERNKQLKELRQAAVLEMLARDGATYRSVAAELGVHFTTVQAIVKGHSSSGTVRPKKKAEPEE
ncbi:helix-turn-helix domain-containing protein [Streptomyces sp. NPDC088353]|uniref:helix-turn-helix domain-containing protein n=1 Tax=Streptomyces sp. NPDC088353 TaxID=3365855 RepID=UPI0038007F82